LGLCKGTNSSKHVENFRLSIIGLISKKHL
jgi:hypothetical protein